MQVGIWNKIWMFVLWSPQAGRAWNMPALFTYLSVLGHTLQNMIQELDFLPVRIRFLSGIRKDLISST